jgi:hypothetical protein
MSNLYDIIIPIGPCDVSVINDQLEFTKKNIIGYRNIYLICYDTSINIIDSSVIKIDEKIFPFTIRDVEKCHSKHDRNGWYLQQLLKLYAGFIIPGILERYLSIDSDTFFIKPTTFLENGLCLYNYGVEIHEPYFKHMVNLHPSFEKQVKESGICHHMMFETKFIKEMFLMVEQHNNYNKNDVSEQKHFWQIFLEKVNPEDLIYSGASEYELYFNYILKYHNDEIKIRKLKWINIEVNPFSMNINSLPFDYISWHNYRRKNIQ